MNKSIASGIVVLFLAIGAAARADVTLPKILGDNMVLQREKPVPIWGHAAPAEEVTVFFAGQQKTSHADANGDWRIDLDAMPASDEPREMTITGSNTIHLKNLLVGEVWFCSGQSNMEFHMRRGGGFRAPKTEPDLVPAEMALPAQPQIRLFRVQNNVKGTDVTTSGWQECSADSLKPFSEIGYFFGKELHNELHVPIGLVESVWGGQRIERFISPTAYQAISYLGDTKPAPGAKSSRVVPGDIYQHMIAPLIPFAIRGALWYQGESNVGLQDSEGYFNKMKALIGGWRTAWNQGDFPFYYVEIAPYLYDKKKNPPTDPPQALPRLWQAQTSALSIPNTGMVATVDLVEDVSNIHPPDKWDVAHRLATMALARDYGRANLIDTGPTFNNMTIESDKARIHFDAAGSSGLKSSDGKPLREFEIAGGDGKFVPATATIDGNTVIVSSPEVPAPATVRYAWNQTPHPNLANAEGLPAFPFQSVQP